MYTYTHTYTKKFRDVQFIAESFGQNEVIETVYETYSNTQFLIRLKNNYSCVKFNEDTVSLLFLVKKCLFNIGKFNFIRIIRGLFIKISKNVCAHILVSSLNFKNI